jgi:hypothetical protein
MDEAKADPSIEWEVDDGSGWFIVHTPNWIPHHNYRKKPKTVDMWQWCYKLDSGDVVGTRCFYASSDGVTKCSGFEAICKIEGSKITVEIE